MRRLSLLALVLLTLAACSPDAPQFYAIIVPASGHVPYEATITATPLGGHYVYELPLGEVIESDSNTLVVTVDWLEWDATVRTTKNGHDLEDKVHARGTNASPRINTPIIGGDLDRWWLVPFGRTLIDFGTRGNRGVQYSGEWRIQAIYVSGALHEFGYTVFHPPYESGTCHAEWKGMLHECAGIVYPCYASVPNDIPFSPTGLDEGYPGYGENQYRCTNAIDWRAALGDVDEMPAQGGTVRVEVVDEFGRLTEASFMIPIMSCANWDAPGIYFTPIDEGGKGPAPPVP